MHATITFDIIFVWNGVPGAQHFRVLIIFPSCDPPGRLPRSEEEVCPIILSHVAFIINIT